MIALRRTRLPVHVGEARVRGPQRIDLRAAQVEAVGTRLEFDADVADFGERAPGATGSRARVTVGSARVTVGSARRDRAQRLADIEDVEGRKRHDRVARQCVRLRIVHRALGRVGDVVVMLDAPLVHPLHEQLAGVGRPVDVRPTHPLVADVVRARVGEAVAVELHAVGGQLDGVASADGAHEEVVIGDEGFPALVGGLDEGRVVGQRIPDLAHVLAEVALEALRPGREFDTGLVAVHELEVLEGQLFGHVAGVGGQGERRREAVVVEERPLHVRRRIDEGEFVSGAGVVAVPEAVRVVDPVGRDGTAGDQGRRMPVEQQFGAVVVDVLAGGGGRQGSGDDGAEGERESGWDRAHASHSEFRWGRHGFILRAGRDTGKSDVPLLARGLPIAGCQNFSRRPPCAERRSSSAWPQPLPAPDSTRRTAPRSFATRACWATYAANSTCCRP